MAWIFGVAPLAGSLDRLGSTEDEGACGSASWICNGRCQLISQSLDVTDAHASCSSRLLAAPRCSCAAPFCASTFVSALAAFYADRLLAIAEQSGAHRLPRIEQHRLCAPGQEGLHQLVRRPLTPPASPALGCSAHRVPRRARSPASLRLVCSRNPPTPPHPRPTTASYPPSALPPPPPPLAVAPSPITFASHPPLPQRSKPPHPSLDTIRYLHFRTRSLRLISLRLRITPPLKAPRRATATDPLSTHIDLHPIHLLHAFRPTVTSCLPIYS